MCSRRGPLPADAREAEAQRALLESPRGRWASARRAICATISGYVPEAKPRIDELVEEGTLSRWSVQGWRDPPTSTERRVPRRVEGPALLSPFDPLVWERARAERLFGFRYRIEIYTPAHKREHGYYVLPFLLGDRLAAASTSRPIAREASTLLVHAVHLEADAPPEVREELAPELAVTGAMARAREGSRPRHSRFPAGDSGGQTALRHGAPGDPTEAG